MNIKYLPLFFVIILCLATHKVSANQVDSLIRLLEKKEIKNTPQELLKIYNQLGRVYIQSKTENYERSIFYYQQALKIAEEENNLVYIVKCNYGIGLGYQRTNKFEEALFHYDKAIQLDSEEIDFKSKANCLTQASAIHQALGDYKKAYEFQMQALLIYQINNFGHGIANSHYNLGNIFFYQNQFKAALNHYEKASVICKKDGNKRFIFSTSSALGAVHQNLKNQDESLKYNSEALKIAQELNYKTGIGYAKANIAANYAAQKNYAFAEKYLIESISIKEDLGDKYGTIGSKIDLGELYLSWEKPHQAKPILEEALSSSIELKSMSREAEIYKMLVDLYETIDDDSSALFFSKRFSALKDSLINEKTIEEMGQSKKRFEIKEKEHEIAILRKEQKIQKLQMFLFGLFLIGILVFLWRYKKQLNFQKQTNELLEEKNLEIQIQNKELSHTQDQLLNSNNLLEDKNLLLEDSNLELNDKNDLIEVKNKQLEDSNKDLQQFAYVASHDLKEPLRMVNSYINIIEKRYNHLFDDSGKEFMFFVTDAVKRMQTLLDDLLDFSRVGSQEPPEHPTQISDVLTLVEVNLRHRLESLGGKMIINSQHLPAVKAHRTQLIQLFQNLISNGVKFKGERDPLVYIDYQKREDEVVFSVRDNGIGISPDNLKKVFEMFKRLHDQTEYEGTGIGLATCKRIVNGWGGDIWVESTYGEGSTFFFSVPNSAVAFPAEVICN